MLTRSLVRGVNVAGLAALGSDTDPTSLTGLAAKAYVARDNVLSLRVEPEAALPAGVAVAFTYAGAGPAPSSVTLDVYVWESGAGVWLKGPTSTGVSVPAGVEVLVPLPLSSPRGLTVAFVLSATSPPDGTYALLVGLGYASVPAAVATTWRLFTGGPVPGGAHDVAALPGKSATFPAPALPPGHKLVGYRYALVTVGTLTGDPGGTFGGAWGLEVDVVEQAGAYPILTEQAVGGILASAVTGESPVPYTYGATATGQDPGPYFAQDVTRPVLRVYTKGAALIVGNRDMTTATYGPGGTFDGLTLHIVTDSTGPAGSDVSFYQPADPQAVADSINNLLFTLVAAGIDAANHLVLRSATQDATGHVAVPAGSTSTLFGFAGGASATDGTPALSTLTALDVTVRVITSPVSDVVV